MLVLSAATCRTGVCSRNIYKNHKGVIVSSFKPQFNHLSFSHSAPFLSKISRPWLCYPFKLPSSFFLPSILQFFTLSDCLVIFYIYFQLERLFIFLCFFFNIHIFAIYLNRNIYVHIFWKQTYIISFSFFYCESPDVTFYHCKTFGATLFLERSLSWD